jgi:CheY-like chemotaxis protein
MFPDSNPFDSAADRIDPAFLKSKRGAPEKSPLQKILHIDDDPRALQLVSHILTDGGFTVVSANSGFEGITKFRETPYDFSLVLLDLTMPFMDGEETFRRLREIRPDVQVVLCTGFIQHDRLSRLKLAGLAGFLRKPIPPNEIAGFVRSTLASVRYNSHRPTADASVFQ